MEIDKIYLGDCLELMKEIPDKSIDCIICDLPYGTTNIQWDTIIPFNNLWNEYKRIIKYDSNVVLFSSGLFTNKLINSNLKDFRYKLIWKKNVPTGMSSAKYRPMKYYEEICLFGNSNATYNPIMKKRIGKGKSCYHYDHYCGKNNHLNIGKIKRRYNPDYVQPSDVLEFDVVPNRNGKMHPTQKPVELIRYLIRTYTNEGDLVLDNCIGSGSTAIAAIKEKRHFIGMELNKEYFDIAQNRISNELKNPTLF